MTHPMPAGFARPSTPAALGRFLDHQVAAGHTPGALLLVEHEGRTVAREAVGHVAPDRATAMHAGVRFRIASLTKPIVSVAALGLLDEGRLALDAPVADWLPELAGMRLADGRAPQRPMSVRDLMRHTSGLAYPGEIGVASLRDTWAAAGFNAALSGVDSAGFLRRLATLPLVAEPGTAFRYGYSTDVLGCVVERVTGTPLDVALRERVLTPLGMHDTGFELRATDTPDRLALAHAGDRMWHALIPAIGQRPAGAPWMASGGGGLISTLDDMARFARLLADGGTIRGADGQPAGRLLSDTSFAELGRDQLPEGVDGPAAYCGPGWGFGLGMAVRLGWGAAAMPSQAGELVWSGISGTALFVQPRDRSFALLMSANMASRMVSRMALRWAVEGH